MVFDGIKVSLMLVSRYNLNSITRIKSLAIYPFPKTDFESQRGNRQLFVSYDMAHDKVSLMFYIPQTNPAERIQYHW